MDEQALKEINEFIGNCESVHRSALALREGIKTGSLPEIGQALKELDSRTDGYWGKVVLGPRLSECYGYRDELIDAEVKAKKTEEPADAK